jgi:hypothetical protein
MPARNTSYLRSDALDQMEWGEYAVEVERPLAYSVAVLNLDQDQPLLHCTLQLGWIQEHLLRIMRMGHHVDFLTKFLVCLPTQQRVDIGNVLDMAQTMGMHCRLSALSVMQHRSEHSGPSFECPSLDGNEQLWELNTDVGFTLMSFDPAPMQRNRIVVNSRVAGIFGMHREEYLARAAARDLAVPMTELDGLIVLLYISVRDSFGDGSPMEVYFRARAGHGPTLLCIRTVAATDAGRIREVRPPSPPQSQPVPLPALPTLPPSGGASWCLRLSPPRRRAGSAARRLPR